MNDTHCCIICLGSNVEPEKNFAEAVGKLSARFPDIRWGSTVDTEAEGKGAVGRYLNKAAEIRTAMGQDELTALFKQMERDQGRTPESKRMGVVPIDIDLLVYDGIWLKPRDKDLIYVRRAMAELP